MAQQNPPVRQLNLGGVFSGGNPYRRPPDTAVRCRNFRPMPGGGLRLRGGWVLRAAGVSNRRFVQFHECQRGALSGGLLHVALSNATTEMRWLALDLATYTTSLVETLPALDTIDHRAVCSVRDRVFMDNNRGVRDGAYSWPALSSWDGTTVRYVGLDAYCPTGVNPNASFGGAGYNNIQRTMRIFVGLHNVATNHFSNGVFAGEVGPGTGGTILVSNLQRLSWISHGTAETSELFYVFYATGDGLRTAYLILNAAGTDVYKVPVSDLSTSLSLTASDDKGFIFSPPHEMPETNFPPRPMDDICYANGRVYGILRNGGEGPAATYAGFTYVPTDIEASAIVFSAAADDLASQETMFVGVPEEAWPLGNRKYAPNGEQPLKLSALPSRGQVLVLTRSGTFVLEQTVDGLHIVEAIDPRRGIIDRRSFVNTSRGPMWVTQHREVVLLDPGNLSLEVLSEDYADLLSADNYTPGAIFGIAADYLLDPVNKIDRYQVWAADGYFVCHDFGIAQDQARRGVSRAPGWSGTGYPINAAASLKDTAGRTCHLLGAAPLWTQEGDPVSRTIAKRDTNAAAAYEDITGDWIGQWLDFGDPRVRKEGTLVHVVGDAAHSAALNRSPVEVLWYADCTDVEYVAFLEGAKQSPTTLEWEAKMRDGNRYWYKFRLRLTGHSADETDPNYPVAPTTDGELDLSAQVYGSIAELAVTISGAGQNR